MALALVPKTGQVLFTTFNALYQGAYQAVEKFYEDFATTMPSNSETQLYHWIAQLPGMKEWIGQRQMNNAVLRGYSLTNKVFEDSIALDKFKVKNDQWGAFGPTVSAFGDAVGKWPDQQMAAVVDAGHKTLCYDGQNFFDTDHPISLTDASQGTFSNMGDGAAYDLSIDPVGAFNLARSAMASFVGDAGQPLGLLADTIMVHPSLERYATMIATSELIPQTFASTGPSVTSIATAAASSNPFKGRVKVIVNPFLANVAGYVYCSKRPIKPFIWQLREAPVFQALVDPTLPNMFERREFVYGAEAQGGAGYSLPFLCIRLSNGLSSAAALTTGQTSTVGGS
jgi:phage major head subunit gpT-like protein